MSQPLRKAQRLSATPPAGTVVTHINCSLQVMLPQVVCAGPDPIGSVDKHAAVATVHNQPAASHRTVLPIDGERRRCGAQFQVLSDLAGLLEGQPWTARIQLGNIAIAQIKQKQTLPFAVGEKRSIDFAGIKSGHRATIKPVGARC
jgi:hypothetical protein